MKKTQKLFLVLGASSLTLMGCMDVNGTYNKTNTGALVGAAVGGIAGNMIDDDNKTRGTALGAVAGGLVGGAIGARLDQQEAELRQQLGGSGAMITNTGERLIVTLPEAITFPVNGTTVKSSLMAPLASLSGNINQYPNTIVQVIGHTDSSGDAGYNQGLSERRASAVASILIGNGVPSGKVQTIGRGENAPIASNDTDSGKAQNRRVEINIIPTQ